MASVWEQRFAEFVRRICATRESSALELLPDLMPVLPVADPAAPELYRARGERLVCCAQDVTAAAGDLPCIDLTTRTSGTLLIVTHIIVSTLVAQAVRVNCIVDPGSADLGAGFKDEPDSRWNATGFPYALSSPAGVAGATALEGGILFTSASQPVIYPGPWVLGVGTALRVQGQTLASRLGVTFRGYVRAGTNTAETASVG